MKVTAEMLRKGNACGWQTQRFKEKWPRGMIVNEANLRLAIKLDFDIQGGTCRLLSGVVHDQFLHETLGRWAIYDRGPYDTRRWRNYLRSIIPEILAAARAMDEAEKGRKK